MPTVCSLKEIAFGTLAAPTCRNPPGMQYPTEARLKESTLLAFAVAAGAQKPSSMENGART